MILSYILKSEYYEQIELNARLQTELGYVIRNPNFTAMLVHPLAALS